jgi:hypothetical protein
LQEKSGRYSVENDLSIFLKWAVENLPDSLSERKAVLSILASIAPDRETKEDVSTLLTLLTSHEKAQMCLPLKFRAKATQGKTRSKGMM